jgi:cytidyltransferase-like protein
MTIKEKLIVTSGYFDPITLKEIIHLQKCKEMGDWLIVGIHSDMLLHMKTGILNQSLEVRKRILESIKYVDEVFIFNDCNDNVCNLLKVVKVCYPRSNITYVSEFDMSDRPETKIGGINFEVLSKE